MISKPVNFKNLTVNTALISSVHIKDVMGRVRECDPKVWTLWRLIPADAMDIALFYSPKPELANQVMFKAMCCGMSKFGYWKLDNVGDFEAVCKCVRELVIEFCVDTLSERNMWLKQCEQSKETPYALNN